MVVRCMKCGINYNRKLFKGDEMIPKVCSLLCFLVLINDHHHGFKPVPLVDGINVIKYEDQEYDMRSSYERNFAKVLRENGVKYLYEPYAFKVNGRHYIPDFILPETHTIIEVKGLWQTSGLKSSYTKLKEFIEIYGIRTYLMDISLLRSIMNG